MVTAPGAALVAAALDGRVRSGRPVDPASILTNGLVVAPSVKNEAISSVSMAKMSGVDPPSRKLVSGSEAPGATKDGIGRPLPDNKLNNGLTAGAGAGAGVLFAALLMPFTMVARSNTGKAGAGLLVAAGAGVAVAAVSAVPLVLLAAAGAEATGAVVGLIIRDMPGRPKPNTKLW